MSWQVSGPVFSLRCREGQDGLEGMLRGVHLRFLRKSQGEAPELIGRLDASSMPVMF